MRWSPVLLLAAVSAGSACQPAPQDPGMPVAPGSFVFQSNRTGNFEVYLHRAGRSVQLTDDPAFDSWWARVSPQGDRVLFYRSLVAARPRLGGADNNYDNAALWMMGIDGARPHEVIAKGAHGLKRQGVADWSPDGARLVMAGSRRQDDDRWHLYLVDPDGRNLERISKRKSLYLDPSWSPDGSRIVFVGYPQDYDGFDLKRLEVFTMRPDGSDERRLTNDRIRDNDPYWSPDGSEIAMESQTKPVMVALGSWALRAVPASGGPARTIIDDGNIHAVGRWLSDSRALYLHRFVYGDPGKFDLYRIQADGSGLTRLLPSAPHDEINPDPLGL